jgi:hypothetical protein
LHAAASGRNGPFMGGLLPMVRWQSEEGNSKIPQIFSVVFLNGVFAAGLTFGLGLGQMLRMVAIGAYQGRWGLIDHVKTIQEHIELSVWIKRWRASGGCLGVERRWRTWHAAKSCGEMRAIVDPQISEWGNPPPVFGCCLLFGGLLSVLWLFVALSKGLK